MTAVVPTGLALGDVLHPQTSEVSTSAANQSIESDSGLGAMQRLDCLIFATLLIIGCRYDLASA